MLAKNPLKKAMRYKRTHTKFTEQYSTNKVSTTATI